MTHFPAVAGRTGDPLWVILTRIQFLRHDRGVIELRLQSEKREEGSGLAKVTV
jgi:hypothetical protein